MHSVFDNQCYKLEVTNGLLFYAYPLIQLRPKMVRQTFKTLQQMLKDF